MKTCIPFAIACVLFMLTGCQEARVWPPEGGVEAVDDGTTHIVLFAPVELGPVANVYPDGDLEYARDMAKWTDAFSDDIQSWVGEHLPVSSSARWNEGIVGSAVGAHVVVLTEVLDVVEERVGIDSFVIATVRMRAMDGSGRIIYRNEVTGRTIDEVSPKVNMKESSQPPARAAWEACRKLALGISDHIERMSDPLPEGPELHREPREVAPLVDVTVGSVPEGADIYVDGAYRGTTPQIVPLPVRPLTLRLQRQGYQVWETELTPDVNMNIRPALEPLNEGAASE